jgi:hypothetical protein
MHRGNRTSRLGGGIGQKTVLILAGIVPAITASAGIFRIDHLFGIDSLGELQGIYDIEVAYGARYRLDDRDKPIVALISGGSNPQNSLLDDGNLNYDEDHLVSNMVRTTGELSLRLGNFGAFIRGYAFYDYENAHEERARTSLTSEADEQVSKDADILDAYLSAQFSIGDMPAQLRVGDQVVGWGQSTFFSATGVNVINPLNIPLVQQATATPRDLRLPVGMVWGALHVSPLISVEAFYQYSWDATIIPERGTYLSGGDLIPGVDSAQFTGTASDLGTDVCARYGLDPEADNFQNSAGNDPTKIKALEPPPTAAQGGDGCFDFLFLKARADRKSIEPDNGGQYGFTVQTILPQLNDTKLAFHYANYHSRLPYISGYTASREALDKSFLNTAFNAANGLLTTLQATEYAFANITKDLDLVFEYPEDIQMFGFSFNTTTIHTGTAFSGEIAHHRNHPFQIHVGQFVPTLLDIIPPGHPGGDYAPPYASDTLVKTWLERDKTQVSLGITQLLGPKLGASQVAISMEAANLYIHDMPNKNEVRLQTPGVALLQFAPQDALADKNSWGYRLAGVFTYNNVFGALQVSPRTIFSQDVTGNSPGGQPFQEGRKSLTLGVNVEYINRFSADLSYTSFYGAGDFNVLNDRDFVNFNLRYSF